MHHLQAHILVVDDDKGIRDMFEEWLAEAGYACHTASSGVTALHVLGAGPVDLVLVDITMPGMSGVTLFQHIKERWPDVGVIFVTAMDDVNIAVGNLKEGADDYLVKPVALKRLQEAVEQVLSRRNVLLAEKQKARWRDSTDLRPHTAPDGTVTIVFSDIEGSTLLTQRLGDQRVQELVRAHNALVRRQVQAHGGFEVKSLGDGFMLAFSSARRALQCAIAIQREFASYNEAHPEEPIRVRMGLHTGEAIKEEGDFYGKSVILAARIADQAQGEEVLVSSLLKELAESAGDIRFGEGREVVLQGLPGTSLVYQVFWE